MPDERRRGEQGETCFCLPIVDAGINSEAILIGSLMKILMKILNLVPRRLRRVMFTTFALLTRAMTFGVRLVVIDDQSRILLVRHTYVAGWHFPGGGVERGETLFEAATKELREECNLDLAGRPVHFHTYRNTRASRFDQVALLIVKEWKSRGAKVPDHEIAETGFFALDNLPDRTSIQTLARIEEVFHDRPVRDYW